MKEIQRNLKIERDKYCICQFGVLESVCKIFCDYQMINPVMRLNIRCPLGCRVGYDKDQDGITWNKYVCEKARERYINAISPKKFTINGTIYRKLSSSAHKLVKETKNKTLFITLTFPKYKFKKYAKDEKVHNECFSKFMENLHNTYKVTNYIGVRERGERFNRYHFHLLCDIKFIDFRKLNNAWNHAISAICYPSKNSLTTRRKTRFVHNPTRALRYVCKYFAKSKYCVSKTRIVFISHSLTLKPIRENLGISYFCKNYDLTVIHQNDYNTLFRIGKWSEFDRFCKEYLYPAFELTDKKSNFTGYRPVNSS